MALKIGFSGWNFPRLLEAASLLGAAHSFLT
jgi:hypothetical protein